MGVPWTQPQLGGPAVASFSLRCDFRWPLGWRGSLRVKLEGEAAESELIRFGELTTPQLEEALRNVHGLLYAILDWDEPGPVAAAPSAAAAEAPPK